jgi:hypothetical protein
MERPKVKTYFRPEEVSTEGLRRLGAFGAERARKIERSSGEENVAV